MKRIVIKAIICFVLLIFPGPLEVAAGPQADPEAMRDIRMMLKPENGVPHPNFEPDPILAKRVKRYNEIFYDKEAELVAKRDARILTIRNDPNISISQEDKSKKIRSEVESYRKKSWLLVKTLREPVNERLIQLANKGVSQKAQIEAGMGKGLYITTEGGKVVPNPSHSGAKSDTDTQGGAKAIHRLCKIAEAHGLEVHRTGNTLDIPELEHTVNRHAREAADKSGSSSQSAQLAHDAAPAETRGKKKEKLIGWYGAVEGDRGVQQPFAETKS